MARKVRLTRYMRQQAIQWVYAHVYHGESGAAVKQWDIELSKMLGSWLLIQFPQDDMQILKKYGVGHIVTDVQFLHVLDKDGSKMARSKCRYTLGELPGLPTIIAPNSLVDYVPSVPDDRILSVFLRYLAAKDYHDTENAKIRDSLRTLINCNSTLEDLTALWPQAPIAMNRSVPVKKDPEVQEALKVLESRNISISEEPLKREYPW